MSQATILRELLTSGEMLVMPDAYGVARVSLPALAIYSSLGAMRRSLQSVRDTGGFAEVLAEGLAAAGVEAAAALLGR